MKWRMGLIFGLVFILALAAPATAEFYKYVDEAGNVRFTDDITQIPEDQRAKLEEYDEIANTEPSEATPEGDVQESEEDSLVQVKEQLDARGNELDAESQFIERAKAELKERKKKLSSNEDIQAYNNEVQQLQQMNVDYLQRVKAYNQDVADYNEKSQQQNVP